MSVRRFLVSFFALLALSATAQAQLSPGGGVICVYDPKADVMVCSLPTPPPNPTSPTTK
jgi:hypothetical protein